MMYNNPHHLSKFHKYHHKLHSIWLKGLQLQSVHQDICLYKCYQAYLNMEYLQCKLHICLMFLCKIHNLNYIF